MNIKHIITLVACLTMLFSLGCAHKPTSGCAYKPTSSWVGSYKIPNTDDAGIVVADFYILADKLDVTCGFHSNTYNFDGTGRLKGKLDDQKFILSGMLVDKVQGQTLIELNGTIRGDTLEGSFVQKTIGGDISITGGVTMIRTNYTTYQGNVRWQRPTGANQQLIDPDVASPSDSNINRIHTPEPMPAPSKGFLPPYKQDAYGPGIWSDGTGRPFQWKTNDGQTVPFGKVKTDAYGPGIGADQYGRPVTPEPLK